MSSWVCPVCKGSGTRVIAGTVTSAEYFSANRGYAIAEGSDARLDVAACGRCGHGWSPLDASIDVLQWYAAAPSDRTYLLEEDGRSASARSVLRHAAAFRAPPGTLWDIGSGAGLLVRQAKDLGWDAHGLEPAAWAVEESRTRGLGDAVQLGDTHALAAMPERSMDAVTAIDIIEHLPDPGALLKECVRTLKPGGVLALVTPRFDSFVARLLGKRWYCVIPAHLHYFTKRSLTMLLEHHGYEMLSVRPHLRRFSPGYVLARLLKRDYRGSSLKLSVPVPLFDAMEVIARPR